MEIKVYRM